MSLKIEGVELDGPKDSISSHVFREKTRDWGDKCLVRLVDAFGEAFGAATEVFVEQE